MDAATRPHYSSQAASSFADLRREDPPHLSPSSLADRALYLARVERAFFALSPEERDASALLRVQIASGFPQRALETYQRKLTEPEAKEEKVIQMCWHAQSVIQQAEETGQSVYSTAQQFFSSSASSSTSETTQSSARAAPPAAPAAPSWSPSPTGSLYYSSFGRDPSRGREWRTSIARYNEALVKRRAGWITLATLLGGYVAYRQYLAWRYPEEHAEEAKTMEQKMSDLRGIIQGVGASQTKIPAERPTTRLSDVIGCDEAKEEVQEVIEYLKNPAKFSRLGGKMPKGILLLGPPGTGKTLLARAVAGEAGVPFFAATGADFEEKYVGVGAKRVRELFEAARKRKPAIIFIDELDTVGGKRSEWDIPQTRMSLNQILTELDGFHEAQGVIIIGATNFAEKLDPALLRPGRFDRHVTVSAPDIKGRKALLEYYSKKVTLDPEVNLSLLARSTSGMTGADLAHLMNTAALRASMLDHPRVNSGDLEYAKDRIQMGAERTTGKNDEDIRRHISVYESGKSLVAMKTPHAQPLHKVTIVQRGSQLGLTTQTQGDDTDITSQSYEEMLAALDCRLGGRVAEELIYGEDGITSNSARDLASAHRLARAMVMQLGFSSEHGLQSDSNLEQYEVEASEQSKERVDREVEAILKQSYERARKILKENEPALKRLSQELLTKETLDAKQVQAIASA